MEQWYQTHHGTLSNFPFPLLTVYQGGTSPVPTFSYKNYNHLGVFLLQNQEKKSAEASVDVTFCRTFLPKTLEDLPEFILREKG